MAPSAFLSGLLQLSWDDLAERLITKVELREGGWSEAKIKLHLGEPKGRHPSTHFRNPLGQPYWTGQQVLGAAVRAGYLPSEVREWPYQVPVHGLTDGGRFIMGTIGPKGMTMHPGIEGALKRLVHVKARVTSLAGAKSLLAERNVLADSAATLGSLMLKYFEVTMSHFPPSMPAPECLDEVMWMAGDPVTTAALIEKFTTRHERLAELQILPTHQDVIDALVEDVESGDHAYAIFSTEDLAEMCGVEPGDGNGDRTTYAYWHDLDAFDEHHERMVDMQPYVSPSRWKRIQRWAERMEEGEISLDDIKLLPREKEVLELLFNQDGCSDRAYLAVCSHTLTDRRGRSICLQFFVGDGGDIEDASGPYDFNEPDGVNCDDEDITHPTTGHRLYNLLWKPRKPKAKP